MMPQFPFLPFPPSKPTHAYSPLFFLFYGLLDCYYTYAYTHIPKYINTTCSVYIILPVYIPI